MLDRQRPYKLILISRSTGYFVNRWSGFNEIFASAMAVISDVSISLLESARLGKRLSGRVGSGLGIALCCIPRV